MLLTRQIIHLGNLDISNVTIQHHHTTGTGDVYIEGYNITLGNIDMRIGSVLGTVQTNMVYYGLTVAASHISYPSDIRVVCPVHFIVDAQSFVTSWYSMVNVKCHSCEAGLYTILTPSLRLSSAKWSPVASTSKCQPIKAQQQKVSDLLA